MKARVMWAVSGIIGLFGCSSAGPAGAQAPPLAARAPQSTRPEPLGLRISLADDATSVCILDEGCSGAPKGTLSVEPLQPRLRQAVSDALVAVGFELVDASAERDLAAHVEWRGTDTIALRLQDANGRLVDQTSFKRSLQRCRVLTDLSWESCWAANFEQMKAELTTPLRQSPALLALARKASGVTSAEVSSGRLDAPSRAVATERSSGSDVVAAARPVAERLDDVQVQDTIAHHRQEMEHDCWLPARDSRLSRSFSSARVSVVVTIAASGDVEGATTTDAPPGYAELAPCILRELRRWRFPPAKKNSTVSIPFVFTGD